MALKEGDLDADVEACNANVLQVVIDKNPGDLVAMAEKGVTKEKRLKPCSNKHSKPPRPPKGPVLKDSDMKLVKEISQIVALKRARTERMKVLKKMKAVKGSSSAGGNVAAVILTVLFFAVLVLQGVCSGGAISAGSPEPSVANKGLRNAFNGPIYRYPNFREAHTEGERNVQ